MRSIIELIYRRLHGHTAETLRVVEDPEEAALFSGCRGPLQAALNLWKFRRVFDARSCIFNFPSLDFERQDGGVQKALRMRWIFMVGDFTSLIEKRLMSPKSRLSQRCKSAILRFD